MKILIIEDEKLLADSLKVLLTNKGFEVDAAYDGATGSEYAKTGIYDLLILDIMLPEMNGFQVAREVRARRCSTPILMLTARSEVDDRINGLNAGADYYLTKPFDTRELLACINALLTMSRQMRGLVESLLELARVDNGAVRANISRFDFSRLVSDSILPFEPVYYEKGLRLNSRIESDILIKGSEAHLRQVVEILLDNAQKYTLPGAEVTVSLQKQGKNRCLLAVANPGEPIPQEELKNIFKRFYRTDKVRSMNHSYGLGLSIAESIIKEHHGRIWAESSDGINTFYVEHST